MNRISARFLHRIIMPSLLVCALASCQSPNTPIPEKMQPLRAMNTKVDLPKFMGDWYVIAHIPTFIETKAYNAVESYKLDPDGTIATTFTFNQGSLDGPLKTYRPRGFIHNHATNAEWRMQFLWPFKAAFLITHLSNDDQITIIGVPDRKYVWIMARTKTITEKQYTQMIDILEISGHDVSKIRRVPHH